MGANHHSSAIHDNSNFVFSSKMKLFTVILIVVGVLSLALTYFGDKEHENIRFWTNFLHNSVFFTGISFASLFFLATHTVAWGGWQTIFKRVPEAMMMFLPFGLVLMSILAVAVYLDLPGTDYLYLWSDEHALETDKLVIHKSAFLNPTNYMLTIAVIGMWALFAMMIRRLSLQQDSDSGLRVKNYEKIHMWAAIFLPIAGFSSAYAIWQWVMSVDTHWYSTLFAWYATVSVWVTAICFIYLIITYLHTLGHFQYFTKEHRHDLGKYIFGFSVFWTYLWFSQFMLIWYANNGEETQYFFLRFEQFKPIFFLNIIMNFVIPFLTLMMNSAKRAKGTLVFMAIFVIFGHWLDYYQMIKPGVWYNYEHAQHAKHESHDHKGHDHKDGEHNHNHDGHKHSSVQNEPRAVFTDFQDHNDSSNVDSLAAHDSTVTDSTKNATVHHNHDDNQHSHTDEAHEDHQHAVAFYMGIHFPGLLELGTMLGFLGLFLFVTFSFLEKATLTPKNDPYLDESKHHHVWYDL